MKSKLIAAVAAGAFVVVASSAWATIHDIGTITASPVAFGVSNPIKITGSVTTLKDDITKQLTAVSLSRSTAIIARGSHPEMNFASTNGIVALLPGVPGSGAEVPGEPSGPVTGSSQHDNGAFNGATSVTRAPGPLTWATILFTFAGLGLWRYPKRKRLDRLAPFGSD